jgi:hypothetical protein
MSKLRKYLSGELGDEIDRIIDEQGKEIERLRALLLRIRDGITWGPGSRLRQEVDAVVCCLGVPPEECGATPLRHCDEARDGS